jgi:hypothetical protein
MRKAIRRRLRKLWLFLVPLECGDPCAFTSSSPQGMGRHRAKCAVRRAEATP